MGKLVESHLELAAIEWLEEDLGYTYTHGGELNRSLKSVVLEEDLNQFLSQQHKDIPLAVRQEAIQSLIYNEGADLDHRNRTFHLKLTKGIDLTWEDKDGKEHFRHIYPIDSSNEGINTNIFRCVNQFSIEGRNNRRPDLIVFINGFPLVVFEFKDMFNDKTTDENAFNQIQHYKNDIPLLFEYNAITVVSDGIKTLHGMYSSGMEWFAPWKSIDGQNIVEADKEFQLESLLKGLFPKERLLYYIKHFIFHEDHNGRLIKKGAKYHQYFGVRFAIEATQKTIKPIGNGRIGVIWHTQGSGKSISMAIYTGILRQMKSLKTPTILVQVDRHDLDRQLHDSFVLASDLVGTVSHAKNVVELRELLSSDGGLVFSTIEKFRLDKGKGELVHPVLSERENIIVIADEAHRTQYGLLEGFATNLRKALPNASFIGFTGTPVDSKNADTEEVFGNVIHTYDIQQAVDDGATVGVFYEPRMAKLHISNDGIDEEAEEIVGGLNQEEGNRLKWAAIEDAAGAKERVDKIAKDILSHYKARTETLAGKAMIVCMSRRNCVKMYDALTALEGCPEVAVIMTSDISKDPKEWKAHVRTKAKRDSMKDRFKNPDDPLQLVIVRDMWLTGFDAPCVHTMYIDKVMQGHNLMQAITRVNRVFANKPSGLVVDYIGIGNRLKTATKKYTNNGERGEHGIDTDAVMEDLIGHIEAMQSYVPKDVDYSHWSILNKKEREKYLSVMHTINPLVRSDERSNAFLLDEKKMNAYLTLVKSHDRISEVAIEVLFFQHVAKALRKVKYPVTNTRKAEKKVKDLINRSIESKDIIDVFAMAGIEKADISILNEEFLLSAKQQKSGMEIKIEILRKIIENEINLRRHKNIIKYKKLSEQLEDVIDRYHKNAIDSYTTVAFFLEQSNEMQDDDRRQKELGLSEKELAFYDIIHRHKNAVKDNSLIKKIVEEVTKAVVDNLQIDWHRKKSAVSTIRTELKRVLRKKVQISELDAILADIMEQAEGQYRDYPMVG